MTSLERQRATVERRGHLIVIYPKLGWTLEAAWDDLQTNPPEAARVLKLPLRPWHDGSNWRWRITLDPNVRTRLRRRELRL